MEEERYMGLEGEYVMQNDTPTKPIAFSDERNDQRYLRSILGAVPVGVVVVDKDLMIQAFNSAAERITGIAADAAIDRPYADVLKTESRSVADPLEEALAEHKTFVNQRFFIRDEDEATADYRPIRHSATVLTGEDGQVVGGVTVFADISRQLALERELADQRKYLQQVLVSIPDGVATTDVDLKIDSWNDAATAATGYAAEDVIGKPCREIFGSAVSALLNSLLKKNGQTLSGQRAKVTVADGRDLPMELSVGTIKSATNEHLVGGVIVFRDISERIAQQRELAQQRRYLDQILETAPYGIFTVDVDLVVRTFNQAAEDLTGFAASFAIGKPYQDVINIDPDSGEDPLPLMLTGRHEEMASARLRLITTEGARLPIRYAVAPLDDADGQLDGAIVIFQDISDIVAAERTKNEFISMVSHELRTPLTSIKGFLGAVLDERAGQINDKQRRFLSISREQSNLLLNLINDLLDLTELESGEIDLTRSRISLEDLVAESVEAIAPLARRKELTVATDVAPDLPGLWADRDKLFQVLQNLLSNAVKFTPMAGDIVLRAGQLDDEMVYLEVEDSGIGISPEEQSQIFDPFYQVENIQTRSVGGTGLGLAIVRRIVEAHSGAIELESEVGVGSKFRICLPISRTSATVRTYARPAEAPTIQTETHETATEAAVRKEEPRPRPERLTPLILTIDDDEATGSLIEFLLEEEGYDVVRASGGEQALQLAAEKLPDLITLDILMPKMDGFNVLEALKEDPQTAKIPVCIVSIIEDRVKGYRMGAIDYITKPFEREDLVHAVDRALEPASEEHDARILIVEDDPHIAELVEMALSGQDYEIITASDGVQALERLRRTRPSLVLLDIMLPKLDGYEFIRQAKLDPHTEDIPIIVISVRSLEEDINRALRLGAEKYLLKPADDGEDLTQVVEEVIQEIFEDE
jgi:PAS domain S-box-containing protein